MNSEKRLDNLGIIMLIAYKCKYCNLIFDNEEEMMNHLKLKHPRELKLSIAREIMIGTD